MPRAFNMPNSVAVVYERAGSFCPAGWASVGCCENASHIDVTGPHGIYPPGFVSPGGQHCTGWNIASLALAVVEVPNKTAKRTAAHPPPQSPPQPPPPREQAPSESAPTDANFLNIGHVCCLAGWPSCNSSVSPDSPGAFEQFDFVAVPLPPRKENAGTDDLASLLATAWPTRLSSGQLLSNLSQLFGRTLPQQVGSSQRFVPSELVRLSTTKQPLGTRWDALTREAAAFAANGSATPPPLLERYSQQLCQQLSETKGSYWFFDADIPMDITRQPDTGVGIAQVLRFVKEQCAAHNPLVPLKIVWSPRRSIGYDSYITQAYPTRGLHGDHVEPSPVTELADLIVVRTDDDSLAVGIQSFTFSSAPYSGECFVTPGTDNALDEWVKLAWKRNVPAAKLLVGDTPISLAIGDCAADMGPDVIEPCMLADRCQTFKFRPGDDGGNPQQRLYDAVETGSMAYSYDVWAQQALFTGHMSMASEDGQHVVQYVDTGSAQEFDFKLRHAAWRGVGGRVSFCAESDYTCTVPAAAHGTGPEGGYHWTQPSSVLQQFRRSEVYMVAAENAAGKQLTSLLCSSCRAFQADQGWCNPPECLPLKQADAICRVFGGRLATTTAVARAAAAGASWADDAIMQNRTFIDSPMWATTPGGPAGLIRADNTNFRGAVAGHPDGLQLKYGAHLTSASGMSPVAGRVLCFGNKPTNAAEFSPFRSVPWNGTHFSMHSRTTTARTEATDAAPDTTSAAAEARPELYQLTVKTLANNHSSSSILSADFQREAPLTPRLAAAIAEVLGATIANHSQVEAAAAAGAQWCTAGLTGMLWPTFTAFTPLTAGTFPYNATAPDAERCVLPTLVEAITVAKHPGSNLSTTGRVVAVNKRIYDVGQATLDADALSDATGLSAVNLFGVKPSLAAFNDVAGNPFVILPFSPSRWSRYSPTRSE